MRDDITAARGGAAGRSAENAAEKALCALGPVAEAFITGAAAAGHTRLGPELAERTPCAPPTARGVRRGAGPGRGVRPVARRRRALPLGRRARDSRSPACGNALVLELPAVPVRPLADYAIGGLS